ncbi:hypothetical protein T4A_10838 [Trichinella pseudospiralis]|uniref:Uncharacterized protein n=1 Tax=Trichinella pseudospiralis TaxID=6337 RepID=A0A0V1E3Y8_TRIPS|nr:hypothetical protein T4A_10838 [Trichinella pseudospiralis]
MHTGSYRSKVDWASTVRCTKAIGSPSSTFYTKEEFLFYIINQPTTCENYSTACSCILLQLLRLF